LGKFVAPRFEDILLENLCGKTYPKGTQNQQLLPGMAATLKNSPTSTEKERMM
jgi:hypothetical protein